jgi:hypothetical protein
VNDSEWFAAGAAVNVKNRLPLNAVANEVLEPFEGTHPFAVK